MLLALMLLAQNAVALHDLEHQKYEHTELCQAFVTADNASAVEPDACVDLALAFPATHIPSLRSIFDRYLETEHPARAPPAL